MQKFKLAKSKNSNTPKSIRFPEEIENRINDIISTANKGLKKKEYSFNGFVVSACKYALDNYEEEKKPNETNKND